MEKYLIMIQEEIEAKNEDEALTKFRKWVQETDASVFEVDIVD